VLEQGERMADEQPLRRSVINYRRQLELPKKVWLVCRAFPGIDWRAKFDLMYMDNPTSMEEEQPSTDTEETGSRTSIS